MRSNLPGTTAMVNLKLKSDCQTVQGIDVFPLTVVENCLELQILSLPHTLLHAISQVRGVLSSYPGLPGGPRTLNINPTKDSASPSFVYDQQNAFPKRLHCQCLNTEPMRAWQ